MLSKRNVVTNMKTLILLLALGFVTVVSAGAMFPSQETSKTDEHTEWIAKSLKEIQEVKVGMTRADLLRVFREEGGISTTSWRRYVYKECRYIKVDVEFEPIGESENKLVQGPTDRITKISKPFLEWSFAD